MFDTNKLIEISFATNRVVRLGDTEPYVEIKGCSWSTVTDPRIDSIDHSNHRMLDIIWCRWAGARSPLVG